MAKGFGAIMAELDLASRRARQHSGVICPLCGAPLEYNGAVWVCRSEDRHRKELSRRSQAAFEAFEAGNPVFFANLGYPQDQWEWEPDLQGAILALLVQDNKQVGSFMAVRGFGGATSFVGYVDDEAQLPVSLDQWVLADWWNVPIP